MSIPEFVQGDTRKAFWVTLKDSAGTVIDLTGGTVQLFATGVNSNDKPTSAPGSPWVGIYGTAVGSPTSGTVSFEGIGGLCNVGTTREADTYRWRVLYTDSSALKSWTAPFNAFRVSRATFTAG